MILFVLNAKNGGYSKENKIMVVPLLKEDKEFKKKLFGCVYVSRMVTSQFASVLNMILPVEMTSSITQIL